MRGRTTPPMFPVILTPAPSVPLPRPRAVRGEERRGETASGHETDYGPNGSRYAHVGTDDSQRNGNAHVVLAITTGARTNLVAPIAVRRLRSASTRPHTHGRRTGRGAARAVSSTRPRTASGVRTQDVSPHPRTHQA